MTSRQVLDNGTPLQIAGDPQAPHAIIVLQEAFGVNDHIREVTERFASAGYYAVAPELFHRTGSQEVAYDNFPEAMAAMGELSKEGMQEDLVSASEFLKAAGFTSASTAVVGYCMGGSVAFFDLKSAWIGLYGDLDKGIPVEQVEALRAEVAKTSFDTDIVRYTDAEHGFSCDARPAVFNEAASRDAQQRTLDFFAENLTAK